MMELRAQMLVLRARRGGQARWTTRSSAKGGALARLSISAMAQGGQACLP